MPRDSAVENGPIESRNATARVSAAIAAVPKPRALVRAEAHRSEICKLRAEAEQRFATLLINVTTNPNDDTAKRNFAQLEAEIAELNRLMSDARAKVVEVRASYLAQIDNALKPLLAEAGRSVLDAIIAIEEAESLIAAAVDAKRSAGGEISGHPWLDARAVKAAAARYVQCGR